MADYHILSRGSAVCFTDKRRLRKDLPSIAPALMPSVPRIWESIYDAIQVKIAALPGLEGRLARALAAAAPRVASGRATFLERLFWKALGRGLRKQTRRALGPNLRCAVSGGGTLAPHVDAFLLGCGVPLLNGYGLTETSPIVSCRRLDRNRPSGVGPPISDTEIRIMGEDGRPVPPGRKGRIFVRGPQVMKGYYRNPGATKKVLSPDGWFDTGDLGRLLPDGSLEITGRAKETIVLAGGENVEPAPLEAVLTSSPLVSQAILVGQDRRFLGALLVPDPDVLARALPVEKWGENDGFFASPELRTLFRAELDRLCTVENGFRPFERIGAFEVLSRPFTPENGLLTQTLKPRRNRILEKYAPLIRAMFEEKKRVPARN